MMAGAAETDDMLGAVAESLYDIDGTGRLRETPSDVEAYRERAASFLGWLERRGFTVTGSRTVA